MAPLHGPSRHLTWAELACKDGTPYPAEWRDTRAVELATIFEAIRSACGDLPITVLSAYRSPAHNRKIGGTPKSQHLEGRALDLRPPKGWTVQRFHSLCRDIPGVQGIGQYRTFVHVDTRPTARQVFWSGGAQIKDDRA